jgi:hypothetical protein
MAGRDETIRQMVQDIVDELDPEQVILLGSRARGPGTPSSDVDFLVVEALPFSEGRSRRRDAARRYRRLAHAGVPKDILVVSKPEVARWRDGPNHVIAGRCRGGGRFSMKGREHARGLLASARKGRIAVRDG